MAAVASYDLKISQGATYSLSFVWKTGAPPTPVDLNGFTARMQIRPSHTSPTVLIELTPANGRITLGAGGQITLNISAANTETLPAGRHVYDLEVIAPDGTTVTRFLQGNVTVTPEVTR